MKPTDVLKLPVEERNALLEAACTPETVAYYDKVAAEDWDEETNSGKGWAVHTQTCLYCGRRATQVAPADIDPRTLPCLICGLRELEPPMPN